MKTSAVTRGWPPARRKMQALRIRRIRPWRFATGPRSVAGKKRACLNGQKHGARRAAVREFLSLLAAQRRYVRAINALLDLRKSSPEYFAAAPLPDVLRMVGWRRHGTDAAA
jgi:hypothetical protein